MRTAGDLPASPELLGTGSGIETKIGMKTRKSVNLTEREISIETIVSGVPGLTSLFKYFTIFLLQAKKRAPCGKRNNVTSPVKGTVVGLD